MHTVQTQVLVLINKIDLSTQEELLKKVDFWHDILPKAEILPISALKKVNVGLVLNKIINSIVFAIYGGAIILSGYLIFKTSVEHLKLIGYFSEIIFIRSEEHTSNSSH